MWVTLLSQVSSFSVVLFFEIMLVAAVLVITWFALYALYRLITDES
ncbi:putative membrane protein [Mycobacteroides abscessus 21]|uniref:Putative membrane protein n=1 Tax=Mycobacteroides abscessus 21 TaxID=1299324 RepID=A0A829PZ29_9MYCO|nr:putative membrane protein [Mycobacteroides abscessus 21]